MNTLHRARITEEYTPSADRDDTLYTVNSKSPICSQRAYLSLCSLPSNQSTKWCQYRDCQITLRPSHFILDPFQLLSMGRYKVQDATCSLIFSVMFTIFAVDDELQSKKMELAVQ